MLFFRSKKFDQYKHWIVALWILILSCSSWADKTQAVVESKNEVNWVEPGETFIYRLRWGIIEVGSATMAVQGPVDYHGQEAFEITYTIQTNSWASKFYPISSSTCSYVDPGLQRLLGFTQRQREGKLHRDISVVVDWSAQLAKRTNFGKPDGEQAITKDTLDQMSLVYALRRLPLPIGTTISIPTTNGKRLVQTEVKVQMKKKLSVAAGKFDALLLHADTKDLQGVFRKSKGAGIDLWVTDDYRRIPIKMKSKVRVGSFTVELVRIEGPNLEIPAMLDEPQDNTKKRRYRRR